MGQWVMGHCQLLRPPAIAAERSIAIGLSVCLSHHVHNVLVLNVHLAPDQSRASISGRDLISPGWLMEQPSLFQAAGVYAGDIELVANFQGVAK